MRTLICKCNIVCKEGKVKGKQLQFFNLFDGSRKPCGMSSKIVHTTDKYSLTIWLLYWKPLPYKENYSTILPYVWHNLSIKQIPIWYIERICVCCCMEILTDGSGKNFDVKSRGGSVKLLEISCIIFLLQLSYFLYTLNWWIPGLITKDVHNTWYISVYVNSKISSKVGSSDW
jgi:hypothetical protein